ncbi:MAG: hypothetical protein WCK16_03345 [Candidatus Moraniibacteriota bacterium]
MKTINKKHGSLMIGVLIMMLVVSATSIAIVSRSRHGATLVTDSEKGYSAYQSSDTNSENSLNKLKMLDNNIIENKIPENTIMSDICDGITSCFDKNGVSIATDKKVADIFQIQGVDSVAGIGRKIQLGVSDRIENGMTGANISVANCGTADAVCTFNRCDLKLTLTPGSATSLSKIKDYEIRKSINENLSDNVYGWRFVSNPTVSAGDQSIRLNNGDAYFSESTGAQTDGQYGKTYYFTVKARNKNPLSLDSLYVVSGASGKISTKITLDFLQDCKDDVDDVQLYGKGCIATGTQPDGTILATKTYNCCNGTECYEASPHWSPDVPHNCALEKCDNSNQEGYKDEVSTDSANGDNGKLSGLGYCGSAEVCKPGDSCAHPYRTVGYCKTLKPASNNSIAGVIATIWSPQNYQDVDMNPIKFSTVVNVQSQPRCSRHDCPSPVVTDANANTYCGALPFAGTRWNVSGTTCNQQTCGDYTITKNCALQCNPGYHPSGIATTGYPSGTCCHQDCPAFPYGTNCGTNPSYGTYTNNSTCADRCATASQIGYVVTKTCNLSCQGGFRGDGANTDYPNGTCCTEQCNYMDSYCPYNNCSNKYCYENSCRLKTTGGTCWNYVGCSGYPYCSQGCGFTYWGYPYCNKYCGSSPAGAYSYWSYSCNDNPSCPPAPYCACGYASTCVDYGCYTGGSYTCNPVPACGSGPSCPCGVGGSCSASCGGVSDSRYCMACEVVVPSGGSGSGGNGGNGGNGGGTIGTSTSNKR